MRQVGRALGANFGVPRFSASLGPGSSTRGSQVELPVYLEVPLLSPQQSDFPGPPQPYRAAELPRRQRRRQAAAVAGAVPQGRASAGAGSLASEAR